MEKPTQIADCVTQQRLAQVLRSVRTSIAHGRCIMRNHDLVSDLCALWLELMNLQLAGLPVDDGDNRFEAAGLCDAADECAGFEVGPHVSRLQRPAGPTGQMQAAALLGRP